MPDKLRANSDLKSSEYATPVLGLIFLKFADNNYRRYETEIHAEKDLRDGKDLKDGAQLNSPQESARFGEEAKRAWAE